MKGFDTMKKIIIAAVASLIALNANAALINIYETDSHLQSIADSQAVINSAANPTTSFESNNIFYSDVAASQQNGTGFDLTSQNAPGFAVANNDTFVFTATGFLDTSLYSALQFFHDDGITVSLAGSTFYEVNKNTAKKDSGLLTFADTGMEAFNLLFWENQGAATLLTYGVLRNGTQATEVARIASVPAPGVMALFGLGLISLVVTRRQKA